MREKNKILLYILFFLILASINIYSYPKQINHFKLYTVQTKTTSLPPIITYDTLVCDTDAKIGIKDRIVIEEEVDSYTDIDSKLFPDRINHQVYNFTNHKFYNFVCSRLANDTTASDSAYYRYRSDTINLFSLGTELFYDSTGFASSDSNLIKFYILDNIDTHNLLDTIYSVLPGDTAVDSIYFVTNPTVNYANYIIQDGQILPTANNIYVIVDGGDRNPFATKDLEVFVCNQTIGETIIVSLRDIGNYTNIFSNNISITLSSLTNQLTYNLRASYGDIIRVTLNNTAFSSNIKIDTFQLAIPLQPTSFQSINFMEQNYIGILNRLINNNEKLYIELTAVDRNEITQDTIEAVIKNINTQEAVNIILVQASSIDGYGVFKNNDYTLNNYSDTIYKYLKVNYNDKITVYLKNYTNIADTVQVVVPTAPSNIESIKFKDTNFSSNLNRRLNFLEKIYIELNATDASPLTTDTIEVVLGNGQDSINLILEQNPIYPIDGYGIFRNSEYTLNTFNDTISKNFKVNYNDVLKVYVKNYPNYFDTAYIVAASTIPVQVNSIKFKDANFIIDKTGTFVRPVDNIYIEIFGIDVNPYMSDSMYIYVKSLKFGDSIIVNCIESDKNSGIFRTSNIKLDLAMTSTGLCKLKTDYNDTIVASIPNGSLSCIIYTARYEQPTTITDLYFTDEFYNERISNSKIDKISDIYITMYAQDASVLTQDTKLVYLINLTDDASKWNDKYWKYSDSISFELKETGENSGKFTSQQSNPKLGSLTVDEENQLKSDLGDTIIVLTFANTDIALDNPIKIDTIFIIPTYNVNLIEPYNLEFFSDVNYATPFDTYISPFSTVYLQLWGKDENPLFKDEISCSITVNNSTQKQISVNLKETEKNSGIFRGFFKISLYTDDINDVVKADSEGDVIVAKYFGLAGKTVSDTIIVRFPSSPNNLVTINLYHNGYSPLNLVDDNYEFNFDDNIYIELIASDSNPLTQDVFTVEVLSFTPENTDTTTIRVELVETGLNTGIYRNDETIPDRKSVKITKLTNDTLNELRANYGYKIKVIPYTIQNSDIFRQTQLTIPKQPTNVNEFYFYTGSDYTMILPENYQQNVNTRIYMQLTGADANPRNADTVEIMLQDEYADTNGNLILSSSDSIVIGLVETDFNNGIFKGEATLRRLSNFRFNEIGTSEGHSVVCGFDWNKNGILEWQNSNGICEIYDTVVLAQFDPPDYAYSVEFRENNTYSSKLIYPVLPYQITKNDLRYNHLDNLSQLWIESRGDTATASNLLNDSMTVEILSFNGSCTNIPGLVYSGGYYTFDWSKLTDPNFVNGDTYLLDTATILLMEVGGPNSGEYRNYNEITNEYYNCYITSLYNEKEKPGYIYIRQAEGDNTFGDTILVRVLIPSNKGEATNIYSNSFNPRIDYTRCATKTIPNRLDYLRLYESNNYVNPIINGLRSFEPPYDALYIQAKSTDDEGYKNDVLIDEFQIKIVNLTRTSIDRGDTYIVVDMIETSNNSNIFRTKSISYPYPKVITKKHPLDVETITRNERGELYCNRGDSISIIAPDVKYNNTGDVYQIAQYKSPNPVTLIRTDETYSNALNLNYLLDELIYIQVVADIGSVLSSNPILIDTMTVWVKNLNPLHPDSIALELEETQIGSEIYRVNPNKYPLFRISSFTLQAANILWGEPGDTIVMWTFRKVQTPAGGIDYLQITDTRYVAKASEPVYIYAIEIKDGPDYKIDYKTTEEIVHNQIIYVQVRADIGDGALIEQTKIWVYHSKDMTDTIEVVLTEEDGASPYYRGKFLIKPLSNDTLDEIGVEAGETVWVKHKLNWALTSPILKVAAPTPPSNVNSIAFTNDDFSKKLRDENGGCVLPYSPDNILNIELNGQDINEKLVDEVYVIVKSFKSGNMNNLQGSIKVKLTETAENTGKYHGIVIVSESSDTERITIRGYFGDVIYVYNLDEYRSDSAIVPLPQQPSYITDIFIKNSLYDVERVNENFGFSDILYIEAQGGHGNALLRDTTAVDIYALDKNWLPLAGATVRLELVETDIKTGIYRGIVKLADNEFSPSVEQTVFFNPLYDRKKQSISESIKKVVQIGIEIPILGNLRGFRYIQIKWAAAPQQVYTDPQKYKAVNNDPGSVSPNPWKSILHDGKPIKFTNLAANSPVKIYDITGHLIKEGTTIPDINMKEYYYEWNLTNTNNERVASGIYLYVIKDKFNAVIQGKVGIIR